MLDPQASAEAFAHGVNVFKISGELMGGLVFARKIWVDVVLPLLGFWREKRGEDADRAERHETAVQDRLERADVWQQMKGRVSQLEAEIGPLRERNGALEQQHRFDGKSLAEYQAHMNWCHQYIGELRQMVENRDFRLQEETEPWEPLPPLPQPSVNPPDKQC